MAKILDLQVFARNFRMIFLNVKNKKAMKKVIILGALFLATLPLLSFIASSPAEVCMVQSVGNISFENKLKQKYTEGWRVKQFQVLPLPNSTSSFGYFAILEK